MFKKANASSVYTSRKLGERFWKMLLTDLSSARLTSSPTLPCTRGLVTCIVVSLNFHLRTGFGVFTRRKTLFFAAPIPQRHEGNKVHATVRVSERFCCVELGIRCNCTLDTKPYRKTQHRCPSDLLEKVGVPRGRDTLRSGAMYSTREWCFNSSATRQEKQSL